MTAPIRSVDVRSSIVTAFRRDLIGPGPQDADLAKERLDVSPSRWYLAGFLGPADDPLTQDGPQDREDDPSSQEEMETVVDRLLDVGLHFLLCRRIVLTILRSILRERIVRGREKPGQIPARRTYVQPLFGEIQNLGSRADEVAAEGRHDG